MKLTISKIDKVLFSGEAEALTVPGVAGEMTILSHHMPLITKLKEGKVTVKHSGGVREEFAVDTGLLEVANNSATVLV